MIIKPQPFPKGDKSYIDFFNLDYPGTKHWLYKNEIGETLFLVYRQDTKAKKKQFQQGSYNNGKYIRENIWTKVEGFKKPLYRAYELANADKNKPVLCTEGESSCDKAQTLFPDYLCVTFPHGISSWNSPNIKFEALQGRTVKLWSDSEAKETNAIRNMELLADKLKRVHKCKASVVRVPSFNDVMKLYKENETAFHKSSFDLADEIPPGLDIHKLIEDTYVPIITKEQSEYTDINSDIKNKKWIYIASSSVLYYDREKDIYTKKETINSLYKRDSGLKGSATDYLNQRNINWVDQQTFKPGADLIFEDRGIKYLNKYKKPKFQEPPANYDISIFRNHLKLLSNYNETVFQALEDTISFDLKHPEKNRQFAVVLKSAQGVGKTILFTALKELYGKSNCSDLSMRQLTGQFQPHMLSSCYFFINEIDSSAIDDKSRRAGLKTIISDESHMVELKGVDPIPVTCHYTVWGATNETIPMHFAHGERRTFYIEVEKTNEQILEDDENYFIKFVDFINDPKNISAIYDHYRKQHKISDEFNPVKPPHTIEKQELIEAGRPQYMKYLDNCYENQTMDWTKKQIVNLNEVHEQVVMKDDDPGFTGGVRWTVNHIKRWVQDNKRNFRVSDEGVKQPNGKRIRFWVIDNHDWWINYRNNMDVIEGYLDGLVKTNPAHSKNEIKGKETAHDNF